MIDTLNFIEDLKEIRKSMPYTNITSELVDSKIKKYEKIVEQFENQVKLDPAQMSAISEYKLTKKVEGYENVMAIVEAQIENNPDVPFDKILESLIEAGLIEK